MQSSNCIHWVKWNWPGFFHRPMWSKRPCCERLKLSPVSKWNLVARTVWVRNRCNVMWISWWLMMHLQIFFWSSSKYHLSLEHICRVKEINCMRNNSNIDLWPRDMQNISISEFPVEKACVLLWKQANDSNQESEC